MPETFDFGEDEDYGAFAGWGSNDEKAVATEGKRSVKSGLTNLNQFPSEQRPLLNAVIRFYRIRLSTINAFPQHAQRVTFVNDSKDEALKALSEDGRE